MTPRSPTNQLSRIDFDPEDAFRGENTHENVGDEPNDHPPGLVNNAREHYVEVERSSLRKLQESISDPKYDGVKISRSRIYDEDEDNQEDEDDDAEMKDLLDGEVSSEGAIDEGSEDQDQDENSPANPTGSSGDESQAEARHIRSSRTIADGDEEDDNNEEEDADANDDDRELADALRKTRDQDRLKGKAIIQQQVSLTFEHSLKH